MNAIIDTSRRGLILAEVATARRIESRAPGGSADLVLVRTGREDVRTGVAYSPVVQSIQQGLIALGYDVGATGADGKLGPNTTAAIKKYQVDHGMPPTGKVEDAAKGLAGASAAAAGDTSGGGGAGALGSTLGSAGAGDIAGRIAEATKNVTQSTADATTATKTLTYVIVGAVVAVVGVVAWVVLKKGV